MVGPAERLVAVGALDRLVQRLGDEAGGGRREMQTLPGAAGGDRTEPCRAGRARRRSRARARSEPGRPASWRANRRRSSSRSCPAGVLRAPSSPATGPPRRASPRRDAPRLRAGRLRNQRALSADISGSSTIARVASTISAPRSRRAASSATKTTRSPSALRKIGEAARDLSGATFSIRQVGAAIGMAPGDGGKEIVAYAPRLGVRVTRAARKGASSGPARAGLAPARPQRPFRRRGRRAPDSRSPRRGRGASRGGTGRTSRGCATCRRKPRPCVPGRRRPMAAYHADWRRGSRRAAAAAARPAGRLANSATAHRPAPRPPRRRPGPTPGSRAPPAPRRQRRRRSENLVASSFPGTRGHCVAPQAHATARDEP